MARFFNQDDIDEFRECFHLYARQKQVRSVDELATIMRSLRLSPTSTELRRYLKQKGGQLSFPDFLEVMHEHTEREKVPGDILRAFEQQDARGTGHISVKELRWLLTSWGDRLSKQEVDRVFREAKIPSSGTVKYEDFVKIMCAPLPDYN
ncbi:calmodulin-like protein 4 [Amphibalanus amphitrite]|uniref:calmodulin-like protein 4 n=1 Tax=Amphibalanus amphitrite TaxID=1232801 RepID=UPI001C90B72D|nr:calmodulin-like protein 4 [Amphibalanus amphitrite]